jgi:hypothetical protein
MRIREEIATKHWHEAAVEELTTKYAKQGYEVQRDAKIGSYPADLLMKKGEELVVFEVKAGDWSIEKTKQVQTVRNEVVHHLGGRFNLVLASLPQEKLIEVEGIEAILLDALHNDPQELRKLAEYTAIEEVSEVVITAVTIEKNHIRAEGLGTVSVKFHWEPNSANRPESDATTVESFPFEFEILLGGDLRIIEVSRLKIDLTGLDE